MSRVAIQALIITTAALLQTAVFPHLAIAGFRPDLLLLVTAAFGLREGAPSGLRVGFAAGLVADLLVNQTAVGLQALVFLAVGYTVGVARPYLAPESLSAPLVVAFVSGLVGTSGYGLLSRLLGDAAFTGQRVVQAAIFVALYNTLLAPIVVNAIGQFGERFPAERSAAI
ncbi:MAG TPA: rod shape-determining protein MreD [Nitriliruptorales bacterium]